MELKQLITQLREATSQVKRLRVAAGSDPARAPELADSLIELNSLRLASWQFGEAAADAPEAVVVAARILAARGPVGPYAALSDVLRYVSATVQLAAIQSGLGQSAAAQRVLEDLDGWLGQVSRLPVNQELPATLHAWAALARARAALPQEVGLANAWADAAELLLHSTDLPAYLKVAILLVTADCRWAAGRPEAALAHHLLAREVWLEATAPLDSGSRPALQAAALAPLNAVHESFAARLRATGDSASGIACRRAELAQAERLGAPSEVIQAVRLGLAADLEAVGRVPEAAAEAGAEPIPEPTVLAVPERVEWAELPAAGLHHSANPQDAERWRQAEQRAAFALAAQRATAENDEYALAQAAQTARAQAAAEQEAAERAAAAAAAAAEARAAAAAEKERLAAAERAEKERAAARQAAEQRRAELAQAHRAEIDLAAADQAAANLDRARRAVAQADDDLIAAAAANQDLAELLRPLAALDPTHRAELAQVLEVLVGLRWRLGDGDASRAAAREARALGEAT